MKVVASVTVLAAVVIGAGCGGEQRRGDGGGLNAAEAEQRPLFVAPKMTLPTAGVPPTSPGRIAYAADSTCNVTRLAEA